MKNLQSRIWPFSSRQANLSSRIANTARLGQFDQNISRLDIYMMPEETMMDEKLMTVVSRAVGIASMGVGILALIGLAIPFL